MRPNLQETADLIIFTEEILNGKLNGSLSLSSFTVSVKAHQKIYLTMKKPIYRRLIE